MHDDDNENFTSQLGFLLDLSWDWEDKVDMLCMSVLTGEERRRRGE